MENKSFQKQVFGLIQSLTGQENVITINRYFSQYMGKDLNGGAFLSQLLYWTDRGTRKDGFIYKTYKEWENELMISEHLIRKHKKDLEEKGVLQTKIKKANGNPTVHYKIDRNAFVVSFLNFLRKETEYLREGNLNIKGSLTEITAEITTETNDYTTLPSCEPWIDLYQKYHEWYMGRPHKKISKDNMEKIQERLEQLQDPDIYDVSFENWKEAIEEHFDELPRENDGDIMYFLKTIARRLDVKPY